jgi:broad specificity phosphatase PhoE
VEVEDTSETPEQVQLRQATYLRSLAGENGNVLAVAHGAYIKHFLRNFAAVDTTEVKVGAQNHPALCVFLILTLTLTPTLTRTLSYGTRSLSMRRATLDTSDRQLFCEYFAH